jgi:nitrite reductase/ring-hydroxylating ferredoxin subunit
MVRPAGSSILEQNNAELARGEAADYRAAIDALPYEPAGKLQEGDEVASYHGEADGETAVFQRHVQEYEPYRGYCPSDDIYFTLGSSSIEHKQYYRCPVTNVKFYVADGHPRGHPMVCPECGADATRDDIDDCTDAHASEGSQDDAHGAHDAQGDEGDHGAQDDEQSQTALSGFGGDN